jgi:hypothetical protein
VSGVEKVSGTHGTNLLSFEKAAWVKEAVEDGRGAGHIAQELASVLERTVTGHDGASRLVAPHDDLEEVFTAAFWKLLHAHVVDDEEVGPEVAGERGVYGCGRPS